MTEEQQIWFDKLAKDREDSAKTLEKPSMRGIKNSVVEKYSDQAHFIYELLQNANDAKAKKSSFQLKQDGLYFRHNGKILFSVSNPDTEDEDKENNRLGHINSITSIANSNKTESSIGKFGVGFKAVFQYTETPQIYDPNFQFEIDRFIIPVKLKNDLPDRQENETVFYFPFDKDEMPAEKAYSDILEKLKKLVFPTLFLNCLEEVNWSSETEQGVYFKNVQPNTNHYDIDYSEIELLQEVNGNTEREKLLLFSRCLENDNHSYSIGFFLDEKNKLTPKQYPAFCFFPTKVTTNLNFILHAPFLLTDSREGIKQSEKHNIEMCILLSQLAADSLLILKDLKLIDDHVLNIIPYKESLFTNSFFKPFYNTIQVKFQNEILLPTNKNGEYVSKENAYWFQDKPIIDLFSDKQLQLLTKNENARWVFTDLARNQTTGEYEGYYPKIYPKRQYIDDCINGHFEMENLLRKITENFIKKQFLENLEWLHQLYGYLSKTLKTYENVVKTKPIFIDTEGNAVPAFDDNGELILFLPTNDKTSPYTHICAKLYEKTKDVIPFGLKDPELKDQIYNIVKSPAENIIKNFLKLFEYYNEGEDEEFIEYLKEKEFIAYQENGNDVFKKASDLYYPTEDLILYFEHKPDTKFVDLEYYKGIISEEATPLRKFLIAIGVKESPKITKEKFEKSGERVQGYQQKQTVKGEDVSIDNGGDYLNTILKEQSKEKSLLFWRIVSNYKLVDIKGDFKVRGKELEYSTYLSSALQLLRNKKWLLTKQGAFVAPSEISVNELAEGYVSNNELEQLLAFKPSDVLTEEGRIAQHFSNEEEAIEAKKALEEKKAKQKKSPQIHHNKSDSIKNNDEYNEERKRKVRDYENNTVQHQVTLELSNEENLQDKEISKQQRDEIIRGKLAEESEKKQERERLKKELREHKEYSYEWFGTYLELLLPYREAQKSDNKKTVQKSLTFQNIKQYTVNGQPVADYFLLLNSNSYIPPGIQESLNFQITLFLKGDKKEKIKTISVSKRGQDLLLNCPNISKSILSQFENVSSVRIDYTPTTDLLFKLYNAFRTEYVGTWESTEEIPALRYIYGPPGTGKTTTVCKEINEILQQDSDKRFLILTPTNKAADVLCKKLYEVNDTIHFKRLGGATDMELEQRGAYQESLRLNDLNEINVIASTIHRLPYFGVLQPDGSQPKILFQTHWDYVIFDEASMIGLPYIVFALFAIFKTDPNTQFIVAGDPKQIPPVIEVNDEELEEFDDQERNIYTMMNINSFDTAEKDIREIDQIKNLEVQYRSVQEIGQLYSEFSYAGRLTHHRTDNLMEANTPKPLPEEFQRIFPSPVCFVDTPLKDDSVYTINKLNGSSYQTYTAILVTEIIKYLDSVNIDKKWKVGLITPYKAQARLISQLIAYYKISDNIEIYADTVHGFQGDECDIVFFVCNPNNKKFTGNSESLLSKEYIYNVAISRARDYLIILHPFATISDNPFIYEIFSSYRNNFEKPEIILSTEIEKIIFDGEENFIYNYSESTAHADVNVFGLSGMKYIIRTGDNAIDIQLRD